MFIFTDQPNYVHYKNGIVILHEDFTYSKSNRLNWYCSRRISSGCKAKIKLSHDGNYIDIIINEHDHPREKYMIISNNRLIKLNDYGDYA